MPPKTRKMAKASAVNNARTRASKAKARNKATTRLVMDSVTITTPPRPRRKRLVDTEATPLAKPPPHSQLIPSPSQIEPAGTTSADAISRDDILIEGWHLLRDYMNDKPGASVGEVSDFLGTISEPELDKAFGDIMGCEPKDHKRHQELANMLDMKTDVAQQVGESVYKAYLFSCSLY